VVTPPDRSSPWTSWPHSRTSSFAPRPSCPDGWTPEPVSREIAAPYGAGVEIDYVRGVPPAVNDPDATEAFRSAATALLGAAAVQEAPQSMGAEDFAWFLDRVPGVLARLGVRRPGTLRAPDLHRGDFDVDETAIACGIRLLLAATMTSLREPAR